MWAHYADKHRGMCLGFDVPQNEAHTLLNPVVYNPKRLQFQLSQKHRLYGIDPDFIKALLYTKSREWSYEREWRVLSNLKVKDPLTGFYFVNFGPQLQLREVVLGARNLTAVGQVAKLARNNEWPQVFKARSAREAFSMIRNQAVKAINVQAKKR